MVSKHYYLIVYLVCFSFAGCSAPNQIEFDKTFELSSFLKNHIRELPGQKVHFQVLTPQGESIPFGLLSFQWVEGGRMSFQTGPEGGLLMEFEKDILEYEVMVSVESKRSKVRVTW